MKKCTKCGEEKELEEFYKYNQCRECDKEVSKNYYKLNKEKFSTNQKKYRKENRLKYPEKYLIWNIRHRAKKKGIVFDLKEKDIIIPKVCPVFKKPFVFGTGKQEAFSPSVDRVDNTKGYIKNNIIVVSVKANFLKNNATIKELILLADFYKQLNKES